MLPIAVFKVWDKSMEPSLKENDYLIMLRTRKFRVGDIIVLVHPYKDFKIVKRVSGVSKKECFVTGDNKNVSEDSRSFGAVSLDNVIGRILFKVG